MLRRVHGVSYAVVLRRAVLNSVTWDA